jgi:hypothetical protein
MSDPDILYLVFYVFYYEFNCSALSSLTIAHSKIFADFWGAWRAFARHAPQKSDITFLNVTLSK